MSHNPSVRTARNRPQPAWSIVGVLVACVGYIASMTPSLLPRPNATQVMASTFVCMTGYAIGAICQGTVSAIRRARRGPDAPPPALRPRARIVTTVAAIAIAAMFTPLCINWQTEQFTATRVPGNPPQAAIVIIGTLLTCVALLYLARGLRALGRGVARILAQRTSWPFGVRTVLGGLTVFAGVVVLAAAGLSVSMVFFNKVNDSTAGQSPPTSALRSGGPGSLVPWDSLGNQGRAFVDGGPSPTEIAAVTDQTAIEPIRIYTGLESADSLQAQANLAVQDLKRAGGLNRKAVIVYTPSTNGLVDPTAAAAAEYAMNGDVSSVSMQYTVLPSFLSIMLSQSTSLDSGTILFQTVRAAIDQMPEPARPKLYVYGESLGAFGSQAPFAGQGIEGLTQQADGALWAGPPANSEYWQQISALSTRGPTWAPIVDNGDVIRFAADSTGLEQPPTAWGPERGVFLQNTTDAVVWWSPSLITARPGWLDNPRGPDVPSAMTWFPLITFELVLVDMPAAGAMPPGIGHNYLPTIGPAWVSVLQPAGWTAAKTERLQVALRHG